MDLCLRLFSKLFPRPGFFRRSIAFVVRKLNLGANHAFTIHGDYRIFFQASSLSEHYWLRPNGGPTEYRFLNELVGPGDVVIDVGANIGTTVIPAAKRVGANGRVYAFEPVPSTFRFLERNIQLNELKNVSLFQAAAGDQDGRVSFAEEAEDVVSHVQPDSAGEIDMLRLDRLPELKQHDHIDLLKVDVEGFEQVVLEGAAGILDKIRKIYLEFSETESGKFGRSNAQLFQLLRDHGFELFLRPKGSGDVVPFPADFVQTDHHNHILARHKSG